MIGPGIQGISKIVVTCSDGEHTIEGRGVLSRHDTIIMDEVGRKKPYTYWSLSMAGEEVVPSLPEAPAQTDAVPSVQVGEAQAVREQIAVVSPSRAD